MAAITCRGKVESSALRIVTDVIILLDSSEKSVGEFGLGQLAK
jgi:hypothetical protein